MTIKGHYFLDLGFINNAMKFIILFFLEEMIFFLNCQ